MNARDTTTDEEEEERGSCGAEVRNKRRKTFHDYEEGEETRMQDRRTET